MRGIKRVSADVDYAGLGACVSLRVELTSSLSALGGARARVRGVEAQGKGAVDEGEAGEKQGSKGSMCTARNWCDEE